MNKISRDKSPASEITHLYTNNQVNQFHLQFIGSSELCTNNNRHSCDTAYSLSTLGLQLVQKAMEGQLFRRSPICVRCKHHGIILPLKGHKRFCRYLDCKCQPCLQTAERQRTMARITAERRLQEQQRIRRLRNDLPLYDLPVIRRLSNDLPLYDLPVNDLPVNDLPMNDLPGNDSSVQGPRAMPSSLEDELAEFRAQWMEELAGASVPRNTTTRPRQPSASAADGEDSVGEQVMARQEYDRLRYDLQVFFDLTPLRYSQVDYDAAPLRRSACEVFDPVCQDCRDTGKATKMWDSILLLLDRCDLPLKAIPLLHIILTEVTPDVSQVLERFKEAQRELRKTSPMRGTERRRATSLNHPEAQPSTSAASAAAAEFGSATATKEGSSTASAAAAAGNSSGVGRKDGENRGSRYEDEVDSYFPTWSNDEELLPESLRETELMHHPRASRLEQLIAERQSREFEIRNKLIEKYCSNGLLGRNPVIEEYYSNGLLGRNPVPDNKTVSAYATTASSECMNIIPSNKPFSHIWTIVNDGIVPLSDVELRHTWSTVGLEPEETTLKLPVLLPGVPCKQTVRFKAPSWPFISHWKFYRFENSHWVQFGQHVSLIGTITPQKTSAGDFGDEKIFEPNKKVKLGGEDMDAAGMEAVKEKKVNEESNVTLKERMERLQITNEKAAATAPEAPRLPATTHDNCNLDETVTGVQKLKMVDSDSSNDSSDSDSSDGSSDSDSSNDSSYAYIQTDEESNSSFVIVDLPPDDDTA